MFIMKFCWRSQYVFACEVVSIAANKVFNSSDSSGTDVLVYNIYYDLNNFGYLITAFNLKITVG